MTDFYFHLVFIIDIVATFYTPIFTRDLNKIYDRKLIARRYIQTWFFLDAWACIPFSLFKYLSKREEGSLDDWENFKSLNFKRLPRLYIMLFLT